MSVVQPASDSRASDGSQLVPQPAWWCSVLLDGALAVATHFAAYWLRFSSDRLQAFLPGAWSTLPFVVGGQLVCLGLVRVYASRQRADWPFRVVAAIVAGTAAGSALFGAVIGFEGISRSAFAADAMLFSIAALGWRGGWVLRLRADASSQRAGDGLLVDRASETTSVRAIVLSLYSYRELLKNLVMKDLKLKYRGSVFGFLWSLANPLLMMVVYTFAFTYVLRIRSAGFVFSLMISLLSWTFFSNSAAMATGAIVDNSGLLKSVLFPKAILPIGTVLFNLAQYLLTVAVFLPAMMIWFHVPPTPAMLLFPVFLGLQIVFTIGVALFLAAATAFFRDVRHLLEVALSVLFWTTPIVYELQQVPERLRLFILLSPVSSFVVAYQQLLYHGTLPEPTVWLVASAHALGAFMVGALLFLAFEDRFTEHL